MALIPLSKLLPALWGRGYKGWKAALHLRLLGPPRDHQRPQNSTDTSGHEGAGRVPRVLLGRGGICVRGLGGRGGALGPGQEGRPHREDLTALSVSVFPPGAQARLYGMDCVSETKDMEG